MNSYYGCRYTVLQSQLQSQNCQQLQAQAQQQLMLQLQNSQFLNQLLIQSMERPPEFSTIRSSESPPNAEPSITIATATATTQSIHTTIKWRAFIMQQFIKGQVAQLFMGLKPNVNSFKSFTKVIYLVLFILIDTFEI